MKVYKTCSDTFELPEKNVENKDKFVFFSVALQLIGIGAPCNGEWNLHKIHGEVGLWGRSR